MSKRILFFVSIMFVFSLIFTLMTAMPLFAADITLSLISGPPGSNVNITGTGFTAGDTYNIKFGASATIVKSGTVPPSGEISDSFVVPEYFYGPTVVTLETAHGSPVTTFTVQPVVYTNLSNGAYGQSVTVSGMGFSNLSVISIYFDSVIIQTTTSSAAGSFSAVFTVPESIAGSHLVRAADALSHYNTVTFITAQLVTVTPSSGIVGSDVTVSGKGFKASSQVTITSDSLLVITTPSTVFTNALGSFTAVFKIPSSTSGSHQLNASDGTYQMNVNYTTIASLVLNLTTAKVGDEVTVTGTGFQGSKQVNIYLGSASVKSVSSDATGNFNATFVVPAIKGGNYQVTANDGTNSISASLSISATASMSASSGFIGAEVTINGNGFYGTVVVKFDGVEIARKSASSNGTFSITFDIPKTKGGNHVINVSDGTNSVNSNFSVTVGSTLDKSTGWVGMPVTLNTTGFIDSITIKFDDTVIDTIALETPEAIAITFDIPIGKAGNHIISVSDGNNTIEIPFVIESDAPETPQLVLPVNSAKAKATPQFDWTDVTDLSGVFYTLEISSSQSFGVESLILKKDNLTESTYTLTEAEKLKSTKKDAPFYWRVKASDKASNESDWTVPYSFRVGFSLADIPVWAYCLLVLFLMGLAGVGGFFLGKRMS